LLSYIFLKEAMKNIDKILILIVFVGVMILIYGKYTNPIDPSPKNNA
jgi:EamA domain-containing membrane protein RarD